MLPTMSSEGHQLSAATPAALDLIGATTLSADTIDHCSDTFIFIILINEIFHVIFFSVPRPLPNRALDGTPHPTESRT
ncbi:hypothetical protein DA83_25000 [Pseudomonas sp. 250J]|nr:hypothetical protein DA83_25000 [Pseudomonas sp. 250J]